MIIEELILYGRIIIFFSILVTFFFFLYCLFLKWIWKIIFL